MKKLLVAFFLCFIYSYGYAVEPNHYPADVAFCIADIKYDGKNIKICEFGQGTVSRFHGYEALFGHGTMFGAAWKTLALLNPKIIMINSLSCQRKLSQDFAPLVLQEIHAQSVLSFDQVISKLKVDNKSLLEGSKPCYVLNDAKGIVTTLNTKTLDRTIASTKKYGNNKFLILDRATSKFVNNKMRTNQLFEEESLMEFRPQCKIYKKKYTPELAASIIEQIPSQFYVIKPLNAAKGYGVLIVDKKELDLVLYLILQDKTHLKEKRGDVSFTHWMNDKNDSFLIEEFVASKTLTIDDKPYDPTLRIVFVLYNDAGKEHVVFLDGYWKLPEKALTTKGSMTEKHKSHITESHQSSAAVDKTDFDQVTKTLEPVLLQLYHRMLAQTYGD
jgi:hypothetical protein